MSKIRNESREVFVTTDERIFIDVADAEKHQIDLNKSGLIQSLTDMLHRMFKITTQEALDEIYDEARGLEDDDHDDEAKEMFDKHEKLEDEMNDFFRDKCDMLNADYDMEAVAKNFIELYQEFGFIRLKKILVFINDALEG